MLSGAQSKIFNLLICNNGSTSLLQDHHRGKRGHCKTYKYSNYMAGQAIDMNVMYDGGFCNSKCLSKAKLPSPVEGFIGEIRNDKELRWGGDFKVRGVVHIDDGLNQNRKVWTKRYELTQNEWLKGNVS